MRNVCALALAALISTTPIAVHAHDVTAKSDPKVPSAFDITRATATTDGRLATFTMEVTGTAGSQKPKKVGKLAGSKVDAYVWPTKLDPAVVGFAKASGIPLLVDLGSGSLVDLAQFGFQPIDLEQ